MSGLERFVTTRLHRRHATRRALTITRMRRTFAATAAILTALILAGCSDSGPSADEKKYADAVAAADPDDFGDIPTDKLADTLGSQGADLCDQLKKGSFEDAAAYAKTGFSDKETSALIAAAVLVYCPDQRGKIPTG